MAFMYCKKNDNDPVGKNSKRDGVWEKYQESK